MIDLLSLPTPQKIGLAAAAALAILITGFCVGWHEKALRVPALLEAQKAEDVNACTQAQQTTKEANDALQKDRDDIAARLASLKLQHPAACVPVACKAHIPARGDEHAGQDGAGFGLNTDWLRDYAAEAELYRSQLMVCTTFLDQERAPEK